MGCFPKYAEVGVPFSGHRGGDNTAASARRGGKSVRLSRDGTSTRSGINGCQRGGVQTFLYCIFVRFCWKAKLRAGIPCATSQEKNTPTRSCSSGASFSADSSLAARPTDAAQGTALLDKIAADGKAQSGQLMDELLAVRRLLVRAYRPEALVRRYNFLRVSVR